FMKYIKLKKTWKLAADFLKRGIDAVTRPEKIVEIQNEVRLALITFSVFAFGQYIQNYPANYLRFFRWHLTNMLDFPSVAAPLNSILILTTVQSLPVGSSSFVLSLGVAYKIWESHGVGRSFDYVDTACFVGGTLGYIAVRKLMTRRSQARLTLEC